VSVVEQATPNGTVDLQMSAEIRKMSRDLARTIEDVAPIESEAAQICRDITLQFEKLNQSFSHLSKVVRGAQHVYGNLATKPGFERFSKVEALYTNIASSFEKWSNIINSDLVNFFENVRIMFSFSYQEESGIQSVNIDSITEADRPKKWIFRIIQRSQD